MYPDMPMHSTVKWKNRRIFSLLHSLFSRLVETRLRDQFLILGTSIIEANALYSAKKHLKSMASEKLSGDKPPDPNFKATYSKRRLSWHIGLCLGRQEAYRSILAANEMRLLHGLGFNLVKVP